MPAVNSGRPAGDRRLQPGQIVPVDSEHSTIAQCLRAGANSEVKRLVLTASGGPFRGWPRERLESVTPEQALDVLDHQLARIFRP